MNDKDDSAGDRMADAPGAATEKPSVGSTTDQVQGMAQETNETLEEARQSWSSGTLSHRRLLS